jgi:hypothetical protein
VGSLEAVAAPAENVRRVFSTPNVVAIGVAEKVTNGGRSGVIGLTFYVDKKVDLEDLPPWTRLPSTMPIPSSRHITVPVDVVAIGRLSLESLPHIARKPVQPGYSIGHLQTTAGTLGAIVTPRSRYQILSNAHVLAPTAQSKVGDPIVYPGPIDGGVVPHDVVAHLSKLEPLVLSVGPLRVGVRQTGASSPCRSRGRQS